MKFKLLVNIDGVENRYIGVRISESKFLYKEKAGVETIVEFSKEYVRIEKKGIINLKCLHKLNEESVIEYKIKQGDGYFTGHSCIYTKNLTITTKEIIVYYLRDNEEVVMSYKIV